MTEVYLDRNKLLKEIQESRALVTAKIQAADNSQAEDVYWTGYHHALEDMIDAVLNGNYDVEVKDAE